MARWDDDSAAVTRSASVLRIGTNFFQRYFALPTAEARAWFAQQFEGIITEPFALVDAAPGVRLRRLAHAQGHLAVVINPGSATSVTLEARIPGTWQSHGNASIAIAGSRAEVTLGAAETSVLVFG